MRIYEVRGGNPLKGEVEISGAKNAALPAIAATLLARGVFKLKKVPRVRDVFCMLEILKHLGGDYKFDGDTLFIDTSSIEKVDVPYELASRIRASILFMGALLGAFKEGRVPLPGGCKIGKRPVNFHIEGLSRLGAEVALDHGNLVVKTLRLKGTEIVLDFPSVTATENIMMAASVAEGETLIKGAAKEPEVQFLGEMLNKMGAQVKWTSEDTIFIKGKKQLHPCEVEIIPDRIEAGTFLVLSALHRENQIMLKNLPLEYLETPLLKLKEIGIRLKKQENGFLVKRKKELNPVNIITQPYPGFPTDLQPIFAVLLLQAKGSSRITETLFENRFLYAFELNRMGAGIELEEHSILIKGPARLVGSPVKATDLRAGAALVLAGLFAENTTQIYEAHLIERGYENFPEKLQALGAEIRVIRNT
jgi:UDP-N-acetylglucosamine 1-carboxyvinyltransferase